MWLDGAEIPALKPDRDRGRAELTAREVRDQVEPSEGEGQAGKA